ncbi:MAG TPA: NADPH-dependent FMN reductase [Solirubrobacteraceae bacterium]|nr:NADPH-dependent FMN reductase [Solirubrobacteraceae bacterium]
MSARVAVIIGSTRPARICPGIAGWVCRVLAEGGPLRYELVVLAEMELPLLDEPLAAALGDYRCEHTRAWSRLIRGYEGFVFVFPQYNWGYPAALKNALDYLYAEWREKPATTVTYGTRGGAKGADQLAQVLAGLHMRALDTRVEVAIGAEQVTDDWQLRDIEATMQPYLDGVRELGAQMLKASRHRSRTRAGLRSGAREDGAVRTASAVRRR